jgi:D-glycero-D-manno-heptose 1,7-bisphosphate phosphatase
MKRRFVILDRDGTIIVERHYLSDPDQVELLPDVANGLRAMQKMGLGLVVVTNQSGIGRGFFDEARLQAIHRRMNDLLDAEGVTLDALYFCPHVPEDECACRKPLPGLIELAAAELDFAPQACFVIGDKACDIELGQRVGATTFLVTTGYGAQEAGDMTTRPDYIVGNLWAVAQVIKNILGGDQHGH